jgi:hypothetical protein
MFADAELTLCCCLWPDYSNLSLIEVSVSCKHVLKEKIVLHSEWHLDEILSWSECFGGFLPLNMAVVHGRWFMLFVCPCLIWAQGYFALVLIDRAVIHGCVAEVGISYVWYMPNCVNSRHENEENLSNFIWHIIADSFECFLD